MLASQNPKYGRIRPYIFFTLHWPSGSRILLLSSFLKSPKTPFFTPYPQSIFCLIILREVIGIERNKPHVITVVPTHALSCVTTPFVVGILLSCPLIINPLCTEQPNSSQIVSLPTQNLPLSSYSCHNKTEIPPDASKSLHVGVPVYVCDLMTTCSQHPPAHGAFITQTFYFWNMSCSLPP